MFFLFFLFSDGVQELRINSNDLEDMVPKSEPSITISSSSIGKLGGNYTTAFKALQSALKL